MQEPSSLLGCLLWHWEGPCQKGTGASFQSKQLKEMQAATPRPRALWGIALPFLEHSWSEDRFFSCALT